MAVVPPQTGRERAKELIAGSAARVRRQYGEAIGRSRAELVTPALVLDLAAARRNISLMATRVDEIGQELRPHIKVHKSPELARLQVDAGAIGVSVATVWEALVMAATDIDGIFIVNTVAGAAKVRAVAELARERQVLVAIDDAANAAELAEAAVGAGSSLDVLIEVDTGMDRAGVDTPDQAIELARAIEPLRGIRLSGVTGYEGHCSLTPERALRHERQATAMDFLVGVARQVEDAGFPSPIVSAGGTATWDWTAAHPGVTEIQAGSYVLMDAFHGAMVPDFEQALTVAATVISRPAGRLIVDAGSKSVGDADLSTIVGHELPVVRFDEEHGIFAASARCRLRVGDVVELVPGYAPSTVNWYDAYHVVEGDTVVDIWPVVPRGPGHHGLAGG